jgi:hypothetical protein
VATFTQITELVESRFEASRPGWAPPLDPEAEYDRSRQMWRCVDCGRTRQWGHHKPASFEHALLNCRDCETQTRHSFLRVVET